MRTIFPAAQEPDIFALDLVIKGELIPLSYRSDRMNALPPTRTFDSSLMPALARYIERHCDETLPLSALAKQAQLSPSHLQRCFTEQIGVSPKAYQEACRIARLKLALRQKSDVSEAIYEAGFGSPSRLYEKSDDRLGMTPGQYRAGGRGLTLSHAAGVTPLGWVGIGATDRGICFIEFGDSEAALLAALAREFPKAQLQPMTTDQQPLFDQWLQALNAFLQRRVATLDLPLDLQGTAFQIQTWQFLQTIPAGQTATYAEVAQGIGKPRAIRAVARACASNTLAIAIPCHRVIRGSGALAGYRWGLKRKQQLLALEKVVVEQASPLKSET